MWLEMIGLSPLPPRTPLHATLTGTLDRGDYVVEKIHFQSVPGAYVIGNLYRPAKVSGKLPAVLYLCGHSKGKVNPPYQANPRWFAQHGYVALVLDRFNWESLKASITVPIAVNDGIGKAVAIVRWERRFGTRCGLSTISKRARTSISKT